MSRRRRPTGVAPAPLIVADALADGDGHLEDLRHTEGRFVPMRFLWHVVVTADGEQRLELRRPA